MNRAAILALALASTAAGAQQAPADGSQNSLDLQKARADALKTKGYRRAYTRAFDLSGLPDYKPAKPMSGVIRQWGSNYLADSPLEGYFEAAFRKYHPNVRFENKLESTFIAMAGLYTGQADLAPMGRRPTWDELQSYQRIFGTLPVEVVMATGSFDVSGWTFALVPFVHADNPLKLLTVEQLDGIFGAQRDGGWMGNSWDERAARGPDRNIRTWGQLGLTGEWADKPIRVLAYNLNYHFPRDFAEKVMRGGYKWNETLTEYSNKVRTGSGTGDFGKLWVAGDQMMDDLGRDRYAITYTSMLYASKTGVKTLPLAQTAAGPFVLPTLESVQDRSYPLAREVYFYTNRKPGGKVNPLVAEYLRFVVSRQGQEAVMRDGKYLPMTPAMARAQLKEIDAVGTASAGLTVGLGPAISQRRWTGLRTAVRVADWVPIELLGEVRAIKHPAELALHREAARITDVMLDAGLDLVREGLASGTLPSEAELAGHVGSVGIATMYGEHADVVVVSPLAGGLVYAGANSAHPHGLPSAYRLQPGDTFMLSLGCAVGGRFVEGERTYVLGRPSDAQRRYHDAVRRAQALGAQVLRPGVACQEANRRCLAVIEDAGLGQYLRHRQGHGIGLGMHEPPWLAPGDDTLLAAGMVVSNEPGLYVPGHAGYRISDSMLVTETGAEPLTSHPRDLASCTLPV